MPCQTCLVRWTTRRSWPTGWAQESPQSRPAPSGVAVGGSLSVLSALFVACWAMSPPNTWREVVVHCADVAGV